MDQKQRLFQAISQNPGDTTLRLVFADWLEEQGDMERAEYTKLGAQLVNLPDTDPQHETLRNRQNELFNKSRDRWVEEDVGTSLPEEKLIWARGFVTGLYKITPKDFLKHGSTWFNDGHPLLCFLYISSSQGLDKKRLQQLADHPAMQYVTELSLSENQIGDVGPLANLTNLKELSLSENQIGDVGPLANLTNLQILSLWRNQIGDVGPLANLTNLKELYLWENQIIDVKPLLAIKENLTYLDLDQNQIENTHVLSELMKCVKQNNQQKQK